MKINCVLNPKSAGECRMFVDFYRFKVPKVDPKKMVESDIQESKPGQMRGLEKTLELVVDTWTAMDVTTDEGVSSWYSLEVKTDRSQDDKFSKELLEELKDRARKIRG